ncbi:hypothetical protein AWENTII_012683 [Aspergillus wentii]
MLTPRQRSHEGCWTCKKRRRKCDNGRPTCQNCHQRGVPCEGYEVRLRWGSGIASRGRFTGADKPVGECVSARPKGRQRDLEKKRKQSVVEHDGVAGNDSHDPMIDASISPDCQTQVAHGKGHLNALEDERLFNEFLTSGVNILHSTTVDDGDNVLPSHLPELCQKSEALYSICLAFQASLSKDIKSRFFEYFDAALSMFRIELANSVSCLEDATLTAGLLLCSIGFMHGLPWTMHIQGMYNILQIYGFDHPPGERTSFRTHLIEVMGVMDLPTFAVGRQNPCLGIWRRYCRSNTWAGEQHSDRSQVEVVSGLPRSLLDIFSGIGEGTKEEDFWNWLGAEGSFGQMQLWQAYKLAGILTLRSRSSANSYESQMTLPKTAILVSQILSSIDAIRRASDDSEQQDTLIMNAINYPVFVAGLEVMIINSNAEWKELIRSCFMSSHLRSEYGFEDRLLLEILEEAWKRNDERVDVDELAKARGTELGLL